MRVLCIDKTATFLSDGVLATSDPSDDSFARHLGETLLDVLVWLVQRPGDLYWRQRLIGIHEHLQDATPLLRLAIGRSITEHGPDPALELQRDV